MATTYPTTKQTHTKPNPSDSMQTVSHSGLHRDLSHTVEALEDKVGINGDTSHSSHDYKLSNITGADKAASNSGYSSHAADSTIHFTEASINHLNIQNKGTKTHAQIDTHINSTSNPHSTTHAQLPDKGTNAHSAIDTHISSTSNPHSTTLAQVGGTLDHTGLTNKGTNTHSQIDSHIGDGTIHFTEASIDHDNITNTHNLTTDIDHDQLTNTHNLGSDIDHTQIQNIGTLSHAELEERLGGGASGASTHALTLNGTTQYAEITDAAQTGLDLTNAFTIEFWLKTTTSGQWGDVVTKTDGSTYPSYSGYSYYIEVRAIDNRLSMVVSDGTNTGISQTNYPITFDGTWHHYACVWQPSHPTQHFVYYKDGVFWDYGTNPTTVVTSLNNTSVPVVVGAITNGGSKGNFFNGSLDEVRVWNDVRTAQEIADNYRRLVGSTDGMKACWKFDNNYKDASTNNNDLTAYNSPTFTTSIFPDPDHTKLANIGTNTHAQIDTAISNSVSHIASTAAHGATGANVGTTNSQILTNKSIDDALQMKWISTPANPAYYYNKLYAKYNKFYNKDYGGVEKVVGEGNLSSEDVDDHIDGGGAYHMSLKLDGVNDYAEITDASQTGLEGTTDFTMELWFKLFDIPDSGLYYMITKLTDTTGFNSYKLWMDNSGRFHLAVYDSTNNANRDEWMSPNNTVGRANLYQWHHLAVSWNATAKTMQFYFDGSAVTTTVQITGNVTTVKDSTAPFRIGTYAGTGAGYYFAGQMTDIRFWNDIRTAGEISSNYNTMLTGSEANLQGYWKFQDASLSAFADSTSNGNDLTGYGNTLLTPANPFGYAHGVSPSSILGKSETQTITNKTFDDELRIKQVSTISNPASGYNKLYFKSDDKLYKKTSAGVETEIGAGGGGGLAEIDTTLYHGYVLPTAATPVWTKTTAGTPTEAITADDKLHIATDAGETIYYEYNDTALDNAKGYTVETRMRVTADESTYEPPLFAVEDDQYAWWVNISSTQVSIGLWGGDVFGSGNDKEYALDGTEWHTYRVTVKGTDLKLYVDGILRIWGTIGTETSTNQTIYFGYWNTDIATDIYVDYIYLRHYDQIVPALNDSSAISYVTGEELSSGAQQNTYSVDMERSSQQYASISDGSQTGLDLTTAFTLECWLKWESNASGDSNFIVGKSDMSGTTSDAYFISFYNSSGTVGFNGYAVGASGYDGKSVNVVLTMGVWEHWALTWDGATKTFNFYRNGSNISTQVGTNVSTLNNTSTAFSIGGISSPTDRHFDGRMDDVRVWNVVRTPTDIANNYQKQLTGTEAGLVGYWKLNNDYLDATANNNDLTAYNSPTFGSDVPFVETQFALTNTPLEGTLKLYMNGQRLKENGDFTVTGNAVSMISSIDNDDVILSDYEISSGTFATGSASWITGELVNETPTGSLAVFTVDNAYVPNSTQVYVDGQLQNRGASNDYTESDPSTGEITFTYNPASGTVILVTYQHAVSTAGNADMVDGLHASDLTSTGYVLNEVPSGSINGSNTLFTLSQSYVAGGLQVYRDGQLMKLTDDYTETSASAGTFTFVTAPVSGTNIVVSYKHATTVGGLNADTLDGYEAADFWRPAQVVAFRASRGTNQSITNGASVKVEFNTETFDVGGNYDNATNYRFVAPVSGYYQFGASVVLEGLADGKEMWISFASNGSHGSRPIRIHQHSGNLGAHATDIIYLDAGEYVHVECQHSDTVARNTEAYAAGNFFYGYRIA